MYNLTSKNKSQSGNSAQQDKQNNFLESKGVEELDDAASSVVNGGSAIWGNGIEKKAFLNLTWGG